MSTDENIRDCLLLIPAFIISDITQTIVLQFVQTSQKTTFLGFLSFFLIKLSKSRSLNLNILRTAWPILMILVSFCRTLNGLSNEITLFWRCSSPLIPFQVPEYSSLKKCSVTAKSGNETYTPTFTTIFVL